MAKLTQEEKDAIRDAGIEQWWKDWFAADYSWDGLAKKRWQGWVVVEDKATYEAYLKEHGLPKGAPNEACHVIPADQIDKLPEGAKTRGANLQDYWRDQEDSLEQQNTKSKKYTIAHLPIKFEDGVLSWKDNPNNSKWGILSKLVEVKTLLGARTEWEIIYENKEKISGEDRRAQLCGCVLSSLRLQDEQVEFEDEVSPKREHDYQDSQGQDEALHFTLFQTAIMQSQNFREVIFGSALNCNEALFSGDSVDFGGAQFSGGEAYFKGTRFTGRDVIFIDAKFSSGKTFFRSAKFSGGDVNFTNAQFSGGPVFFDHAYFTGGNAFFNRSQFSDSYAFFYSSHFSGGEADFANTRFSDGGVLFDQTEFLGGVNFVRAQFSGGPVFFKGVRFLNGDADFSNTKFITSCNFQNSIFQKQVLFCDTIFPPAAKSESVFRGTQFLGPIDFSKSNSSQLKDENGKPFSIEQTVVPYNAFDNANIKDQLILSGQGDDDASKDFKLALAAVEEACFSDDKDIDLRIKDTKKAKEAKEASRESRYVALERGCTTLKNAMEKTSDKNRAQRYFKFELLARQRRPSTPWAVKKMTSLYGLVADYGGSITRPLSSLFVSWAFFAFIYGVNAHLIGVTQDNPWTSLWGPMDFSLTHIFRPLFVWSSSTSANEIGWLPLYKDALSGGGWLTIKVLATVQSLASITLLFLFGLATKRKFQIS